MIQNQYSRQAKAYFNDALSTSDYYLGSQEVGGCFRGKVAERLGISGPVNCKAFFSLCDNRHPVTGKRMTARTVDKRTVFYDHLSKLMFLRELAHRENTQFQIG
jgi:hypothetical protein